MADNSSLNSVENMTKAIQVSYNIIFWDSYFFQSLQIIWKIFQAQVAPIQTLQKQSLRADPNPCKMARVSSFSDQALFATAQTATSENL